MDDLESSPSEKSLLTKQELQIVFGSRICD